MVVRSRNDDLSGGAQADRGGVAVKVGQSEERSAGKPGRLEGRS